MFFCVLRRFSPANLTEISFRNCPRRHFWKNPLAKNPQNAAADQSKRHFRDSRAFLRKDREGHHSDNAVKRGNHLRCNKSALCIAAICVAAMWCTKHDTYTYIFESFFRIRSAMQPVRTVEIPELWLKMLRCSSASPLTRGYFPNRVRPALSSGGMDWRACGTTNFYANKNPPPIRADLLESE